MDDSNDAELGAIGPDAGFTLVEVAVVLVIVGLVSAMLFAALRSLQAGTQVRATAQALQAADAALVNYAILAHALPCPANMALPVTDPLFGRANSAGPCASQANGVVPWITLGLKQSDVTDGFGSLITYRVAPDATTSGSMSLADCDSNGTGPAGVTNSHCLNTCPSPIGGTPILCTSPLTALLNRGIIVSGTNPSNPSDLTNPTGAAYVLISHGENRARSYTPQAGYYAGDVVGPDEATNGVNNDYQAGGYVDRDLDANAATHFDDVLLHPSLANVIGRANTGARTRNP
jgi:prepilin-type N-terminal cleavage/methylation domain-containing protein